MVVNESTKDLPATPKQTWLLFTLTKKDYRDANLTREEAGEMIANLLKARGNKYKEFERILSEAIAAGNKALAECKPTPMIVQQHSHPLNDNSPVEKEWFVEGGVCGFAWVVVTPGTSSFARWLRKQGYTGKDYYSGGVTIHANGGGQSLERKVAWASAFAGVLQDNGIDASVRSRMD